MENNNYDVIDLEIGEEKKNLFQKMADVKISLPWVLGGALAAVGACVGTGFICHSAGYKKAVKEFNPDAATELVPDEEEHEEAATA